MRDVVLIPAYEPDEKLVELVAELKKQNVGILVVNDGSGEAYEPIFAKISDMATILTLEKNSGKGAALKFGMAHIKERFPVCERFVTCDADGQHRPADVKRVLDTLKKGADFVLTVRKLGRKIPLRSKVGNDLSRFVYTVMTCCYLSDNQSGLRGFDVKHIEWLLKVKKDKYDYEMNVLYYASKLKISITTLPIEAIYIDNNQSSHFNPIKDTVRIYKCLFESSIGTVLAIVASQVLLMLFSVLFGYSHLFVTVPSVGATYVLFNILLNRFWVFRNVTYKDYLHTVIYGVINHVIYTIGCVLFALLFPRLPLFFAFNFSVWLFIPIKYFMYKFLYIASRNDVIAGEGV